MNYILDMINITFRPMSTIIWILKYNYFGIYTRYIPIWYIIPWNWKFLSKRNQTTLHQFGCSLYVIIINNNRTICMYIWIPMIGSVSDCSITIQQYIIPWQCMCYLSYEIGNKLDWNFYTLNSEVYVCLSLNAVGI